MTRHKVSKCTCDSYDFLKVLAKLKTPKKRKAFLELVDDNVIKSICECTRNLLEKNIRINENDIKKLKPYKNHLKFLAENRNASLKMKRKRLIQKGGFLSLLLRPVLTALAGVIAERIL
jgi:hypothetical protein